MSTIRINTLFIFLAAFALTPSVAFGQNAAPSRNPAEGKDKRVTTHPELPVFPRATLERTFDEVFTCKAKPEEKDTLRQKTSHLYATDDYPTVRDWYQRNLGPKFTRWEKEYIIPGKYLPRWFANFDVDVKGVIYSLELTDKVMMITIQPHQEQKTGTEILFWELIPLPAGEKLQERTRAGAETRPSYNRCDKK